MEWKVPDSNIVVRWTDENDYGIHTIGGKEVHLHEYLAFDQQVMEQFGITQTREWIQWWVKYRAAIRSPVSLSRFERIASVFSIWAGGSYYEWVSDAFDYDSLKRTLSGNLTSAPLTFLNNSTTSRTQPQGFILFDNPGSELPEVQTIEGVLYGFDFRGISFRLGRQTSVQSTVGNLSPLWTNFHEYSYKMDPSEAEFFRSCKKDRQPSEDSLGEVMLGMELEISTKLSIAELQKIVTEVEPKQEPFFIVKKDSSISGRYDNKYELVTVPCTPAYLKREWKLFFAKLESLCTAKGKYISDVVDTSDRLTNGLHIHVSRDKFYERGMHLKKFLTVLNQHDKAATDFINKFSGRPGKYTSCSYCPPDREFEGRTLPRRLKIGRSNNRMGSCHTQNSKTVEVRVFQGVFNIDHVVRSIEFVQAVFYFCMELSYRMYGMNFSRAFTDFVLAQPGYRALKKELKV
jgi:hypothetical protein